MVVHRHLKGDFDYNRMNVHIEHDKMGIVSLLEREKSLLTLLFDDGRKDNILEGLEVNDKLDIKKSIYERCIIKPL